MLKQHSQCVFSFSEVAIFTIGLKYVYKLVEIYSQLGWNISENPTDHSGPSFFEVGWSKRGSKMNIHNFFEIFLENLNMISIGLKYFWRSCPSQYVFIFWSCNVHNVCLHFFLTMFLDLFLFLNIKIDDCQYLRSQFLKN